MADLVTIATEQPTIAMVAKQNPKGYADTIASIVSETIQVSGRKDITDGFFNIENQRRDRRGV